MTDWHEYREYCHCRQCTAARVQEEIKRVKEQENGMHVLSCKTK